MDIIKITHPVFNAVIRRIVAEVSIAKMDVVVDLEDDQLKLVVTYLVSADPKTAGEFALDCQNSPITVIAVKASGRVTATPLKSPLVWMVFEVAAGEGTGEIVLSLLIDRWAGIASFPRHLPTLIERRARTGEKLPELTVASASQVVTIGGIQAEGSHENRFIQAFATLAPLHWFQPSGRLRVALTEQYFASTPSNAASQPSEYIASIMRFLEDVTGVRVQGSILIGTVDDSRGIKVDPQGCVVYCRPDTARRADADGFPNAHVIASALAELWWGYGCRVSIHEPFDTERGVCLGLGIHWAYLTEKRDYQRSLPKLRKFALGPPSFGRRVLGKFRLRMSSRLTLATHHQLRIQQGADLANLTHNNWGRWCDADAVAQAVRVADGEWRQEL